MLTDTAPAATLAVKSLDRARPFYEQKLGLEPVEPPEMGSINYRAGGAEVMVYESDFAGTNKATAVTWPLGDAFDETVRDLQAKGVAFERYEMPDARLEGDVHVFGDMRMAWFKDPDGNIIGIGNYKN